MSVICFLCGQQDKGNVVKGVNTCWRCVYYFCSTTQERIRALYGRLMAKDMVEKARVVKRFVTENEPDIINSGREIKDRRRAHAKHRRVMGRGRPR